MAKNLFKSLNMLQCAPETDTITRLARMLTPVTNAKAAAKDTEKHTLTTRALHGILLFHTF